MERDRFRNLQLKAGKGTDNFTMSRGSFRYSETLHWYANLVRMDPVSGTKKDILAYRDNAKGKVYRLEITEENGFLHVSMPDQGNANRFMITFETDEAEHIYGCGETYSKFDLKGEKVRIFTAEHQNAKRIAMKLAREKVSGVHPDFTMPFSSYESYFASPVFVSSRKWFLFADTSRYAVFDFTKKNQISLYFQEKPDFWIGEAESFEELSMKLSSLLGKQRPLPDWIYDGSILAVQGGPSVIDRKIETCEKYGIHPAGIWSQDWCGCRKNGFGYQVMWNWKADDALYPNLKEHIAKWKEKGIRFLGYINPFIALERDLYRYASEKGYLVKNKKGEDYLVTITVFPAAMIDFTNPAAYAWYKKLIKENMIGIGMAGWMADFGEYLPLDAVLFDGDPEVLHNRWASIWAKMNREAIEECGKEDEVFFFTRAGSTDSVKYSDMMWTGDQHVDWSKDDGLPSVIPAALSLAMSGCGITHSDAGGYTTIMHMRRSEELLKRWEELCVFSPLFRTHEGNQPENNVQFDDNEALLKHLAKMDELHRKLKPYLKACEKECTEKGIPVMRPLFYHYDEEQAYTEMSEYLLGRDILVSPVLAEGALGREVYFPDDTWVHLLTGQEYAGGTAHVPAPIGVPPVFIRKKSSFYEELIGKR